MAYAIKNLYKEKMIYSKIMVNNSIIHITPRYEMEDINLIIHNINGEVV